MEYFLGILIAIVAVFVIVILAVAFLPSKTLQQLEQVVLNDNAKDNVDKSG